jgi:hypothetical protein
MPRKNLNDLNSKTTSTPTSKPVVKEEPVAVAKSAPVSTPKAAAPQTVSEYHPADTNGDGKVSAEEHEMYMEFKRKELEDMDAMRDAQRNMAWFSLAGMLLYPFAVVLATLLNLDQAGKILGDMAATYFVSVAAIVMAFFGAQAYTKKKK